MKEIVRKIIAIVLAVTLTITIEGPITFVSAAEMIDSGVCGDNLTWNFYDDGTLVIQGTGDMYDYDDFPSEAHEDDESPWGSYRYEIETVKIEEGVTSVGAWAFATCKVLQNVDISDSVTRINAYSFIWCSQLKDITLSDNITYIGESAFLGAGLRELTLPKEIKTIGRSTFQKTDLEKVIIHQDIDMIEETAFEGCASLMEVDFHGTVNEIGEQAFAYCTKLQSFGNVKTIKKIGKWSFYDCECLPGIEIFKGLEEIGEAAFSNAFVEGAKIIVPNTVKQIGTGALGISYGSKVTVPDTVEIIGSYIAQAGKLIWQISKDAVVKKNSIVEGDRVVFENNDATSIVTTESVMIKNESGSTIYVDGEKVSDGETYVSKPFTERPTEIPTTEPETKETESPTEPVVTEPSDILTGTIGGNGAVWTFDRTTGRLIINSGWMNVTLYQEELQKIANEVRHLVFEEGIEEISTDFGNPLLMPNLETVTLPASLNKIDERAFNNVQKLTAFIVDKDNQTFEVIDGALYNKKEKKLIKFPAGKKDTVYSVKEGTKSIGKYAFYNTRNIKEIIAPESVSAIYLNFQYLVNIGRITLYNPNCVIYKELISNQNLVIISYENSQVEATCKNLKLNFEKLEIVNKVKNITVTSSPEQTTYVLGRKPELKGLKIRVTYEDGTVANTDAGYTVSQVDVNQLGEQKINIYFGNGETSITVNYVEMKEDDRIDINARKTFYLNGAFPYKEYYFTPVNSGSYNIYTLGVGAAFYNNCVIMDMNNRVIKKQMGNPNYNFNVELNAGETYIIRTEIEDKDDDAKIALYVKLKELKGECNHHFNQYVKTVNATCTSKGYKVYRCEYCNEETKTDVTDMIEHDYQVVRIIPPTCTQDGYIVYHCADCGYKMGMADKDQPVLQHRYVDTIVSPTITEYGYTLHECSKCNHSYKSDWMKPLGFDKNETTTIDEPTTKVEPVSETATIKVTLAKPGVKAKRTKKKIKLTLSSTNKNVKYQIYVKKNGKYKLIKTTTKKTYRFYSPNKCYIKVRCVRYQGKKLICSKYKKITVKKYKK